MASNSPDSLPPPDEADVIPGDAHSAHGEPACAERSGRLGAALWRWVRRLMVTSVLLMAAGLGTLWLVLRSYEEGLPSTADLKNYQPPQVTRVLARDGTLLAELFVQRRTVVSIAHISKEMKVAVLAAEDADFYQHEGLDYLGMLRALLVNLRSRKARQGGSTITQQVVKNVLLTPERTYERKAREVLLARRIEQEMAKDEILELYLNHIYFGHGRYGVEEACRYYFGKGVDDVTLGEAAMIAGLAKGPSLYSPRVNYERALRRRNTVLDQIALKGFATLNAVALAKREPIALAPATEAMSRLAPEVVSEVQRQLRQLVGEEAGGGGYTITTTLDPDLQAAARRSVRENLDRYAERHGLLAPIASKAKGKAVLPFQGTPTAKGHRIYRAVVTGADDAAETLAVRVGTVDGVVRLRRTGRYNPKGLPPSQFATIDTLLRVSANPRRGVRANGVPTEFLLELAPQSALVAIDLPTREIRALVGSYEAVRGGLDRASRAHRQPGSTFKPFVYGYAIQSRKLTAASQVGRPPKEGSDKPPLLLRAALAHSNNDAAVWTLKHVGPKNVVAWAHEAGIHSRLEPTESLALGAYEVTPLELATAYATFASGGIYEEPTLILRIIGPDGAELEVPRASHPRRRVMKKTDAFMVTDLLRSVVAVGTGRKARDIGFAVAGKTGTSNDAKDAWFAGYSHRTVCVVWTGYDDAVSLRKRESGASAALPAWIAFMKHAHAGREPGPFDRPPGIVSVTIDPKTGLLPYEEQEATITELFIEGTEPNDSAESPEVDDPYAEIDDALPPPPPTTSSPGETPTARVVQQRARAAPGDTALAPAPPPPPL